MMALDISRKSRNFLPTFAAMRMPNTIFIGKVYKYFEELNSTNDYALEMLAKNKPAEGTIIRAATQSAGRGQFGSRWESSAGQNLLMSAILYPRWLEVSQQFELSIAVALALYDTVAALSSQYANSVHIKWPNDLYLNAQKVAGILIQNNLQGAVLRASVVGIGLNVNQTQFSETAPNATSLALCFGKTFDLEALTAALCENLERCYLALKAGNQISLRMEYERRLFRRGEITRFETPDQGSFVGTILGVAEDGRLKIEAENGTLLFNLKEVFFAKDA